MSTASIVEAGTLGSQTASGGQSGGWSAAAIGSARQSSPAGGNHAPPPADRFRALWMQAVADTEESQKPASEFASDQPPVAITLPAGSAANLSGSADPGSGIALLSAAVSAHRPGGRAQQSDPGIRPDKKLPAPQPATSQAATKCAASAEQRRESSPAIDSGKSASAPSSAPDAVALAPHWLATTTPVSDLASNQLVMRTSLKQYPREPDTDFPDSKRGEPAVFDGPARTAQSRESSKPQFGSAPAGSMQGLALNAGLSAVEPSESDGPGAEVPHSANDISPKESVISGKLLNREQLAAPRSLTDQTLSSSSSAHGLAAPETQPSDQSGFAESSTPDPISDLRGRTAVLSRPAPVAAAVSRAPEGPNPISVVPIQASAEGTVPQRYLIEAQPGTSPLNQSLTSDSPLQDSLRIIDSGSGHLTWTHTGAHEAEAGFNDPVLGWVAVRADTHSGGIHAALMASSPESTATLAGQIAGVEAHLAQRQIPVDSVSVANIGGQGTLPGDSAGQGAGQQARQQQDRTADSTAADISARSDSPPARSPATSGENSLQPAEPPSSPGLGRHISVRA